MIAWVARLVWRCVCFLMMAGGGWAQAAELPAPWRIDHAERAQGTVLGDEPAVAGAVWQRVTLPDAWRLDDRTGTWTYRVRVPTCGAGVAGDCLDGDAGAAFWLPRAGCGVALWVNGRLVVRLAQAGGRDIDRGHRPILQTIPPALLREARPGLDNDVRLVVSSPSAALGGVSRIWGGTEASLHLRHAWRDVFLTTSAMATVSIALMVAFAGLWVAWRNRVVGAGLFALVSTLWALHEALWMLGPLAMPWDLSEALGQIVRGAALMLATLLLLRLLGKQSPTLLRLVQGTLAVSPLVLAWRGWHAEALADALVRGWLAGAHALALWATALTFPPVLRQPSRARVLILLWTLGVAVLALRELWHEWLSPAPLSFEYLRMGPFMALSSLLVVCVSIYVRVNTALAAEAHHKEAMRREIEVQRQELEALHARERVRAQAEAVTDERARIVRDMHDGLGSQLVGMLSAVESGGFTRDELLEELNEALSQLRLTIDSLEPIGEDLSSLLGQLRYRLDTRLRKAGFKVVWDVAPMPTETPLSASHINHLQRLLYETFSNVIKHSHAASVWVHASHDEATGMNLIVVRDDGQGFETGRPGGRGLSNLAHRAAQLGAAIEVKSAPGQGTQVSLRWAVNAA